MNRKLTQKQLLFGFICVDIVLLVTAVILFGYILSHRNSAKETPKTVATPPAMSTSPLPASPSPRFTPTPAPTNTPQPLETASFAAFQFMYVAAQMEVQDRSQETGAEAVAVIGSEDIPRVDIQVMEPLVELTQAQFEVLARSAVSTYFAAPPENIALEDSVTGRAEYSARLILPETAASPELMAYIRLLLTDDHSILAVCLLPKDIDSEAETVFRDVLDSITAK